MYRRLLFSFLLFLLLPAPARAADILLASYEPNEVSDLAVTSPRDASMTITWPLLGDANGVPPATEGTHVLRMEWTVESDQKVDIKHLWTSSRFDNGDEDHVLVDIYIATAGALPQIMGIWDEGTYFGWREADCLPPTTNHWYTVSLSLGGRDPTDLGRIEALIFEEMAGISGTIYVDNLRFGTPDGTCPRLIEFSSYMWAVLRSDWPIGVGPNCFTGEPDNVRVDPNGRLHLVIVQKEGGGCDWYSSEVIVRKSFGYGTYVFTIKNRLDFDEKVILGAFTWDGDAPAHHYREMDFEFGRWQDPNNDNSQFVVQPWNTPGNICRFNTDYSGPTDTTTHVMVWRPDRIRFISYYGNFTSSLPPAENIIHTWEYTGSDIPLPGDENIRMNLWLVCGEPPANGQEVEMIIADFRHSADPCFGLGGDTDGDTLCDDADPCKHFANTQPLVINGFSGVPDDCLCGDFDGDGFHSATDAAAINDCAAFIRSDCVSERDEVAEPFDGFYSATDADLVNRAAAFIDPAYTLQCSLRPEGTCGGLTGVPCVPPEPPRSCSGPTEVICETPVSSGSSD
jgi:hypothetical protein